MSRGKARPQMSMQMELPLEDRGEALRAERSGEAGRAAQGKERSGSEHRLLMERVVARENAIEALKARAAQQGQSGHRRYDGGAAGAAPVRTLASDPRATAGGELPAECGEATV